MVDLVHGDWPRLGALTTYDIVAAIAAYLKLELDEVYLHAGALEGARHLGIRVGGRRSIPVRELPPALRRLSPAEAEDVLCIYKDVFSRLANNPTLATPTAAAPTRALCSPPDAKVGCAGPMKVRAGLRPLRRCH